MAKVVDAIRALERDRFRAMVDGDGEALAALLSDKVFFVHTNGTRETKQQFIDAIPPDRNPVAGRAAGRRRDLRRHRPRVDRDGNEQRRPRLPDCLYVRPHARPGPLVPVRVAGDAVRDRDVSAGGAPFHVPTEAAF